MTASPAALHTATLACLQGLSSVTVFNGDVPTRPPADPQGRVYPYVVLWGTPGHPSSERRFNGDSGGLDWSPQVTVAAGTVDWLLAAVPLVRAALDGARLTPWVTLRERDDTTATITKDPDAAPPRWFLPLYFRTLATR